MTTKDERKVQVALGTIPYGVQTRTEKDTCGEGFYYTFTRNGWIYKIATRPIRTQEAINQLYVRQGDTE